MTEELIKSGAIDINAKDSEGRTPLYISVLYGKSMFQNVISAKKINKYYFETSLTEIFFYDFYI